MEDYSIILEKAPSEFISEYIDFSQFKKIRLNSMSETNGILILEYSNDKNTVDISNEVRLVAGKWISQAVEPKMKFFRYHLKMIEEDHKVQVNLIGTKIIVPISNSWFY